MRPKVAVVILVLASGILGIFLLIPLALHRGQVYEAPGNLPAVQARTSGLPQKQISTPAPSIASRTPAIPSNLLAVATDPVVQDKDHAEHVQERIAELTALAMNNDTNSLNIIWSELANPDKDIRVGALAAVVQFGDRSVAPRLRDLATQTEDPAEKAEIIKAADYLELPSLTDLPRVKPRVQKPIQPK